MTSARGVRSFVIGALGASLLSIGSGCVDAATHETTAKQLDAMMRAMAYKEQQMRGLEWQVATLGNQLREAQARNEAALREVLPRVEQAKQDSEACAERLRREEKERSELVASLAASDRGGARGRPDEMRRLLAVLEAHNATLVAELGRLSQKLDAHAVEDQKAARARASKPERMSDGDVVDPWGFGARK